MVATTHLDSQNVSNTPEAATIPAGPSQWTLAQVQAALSRPLPDSLLAGRPQGGQTIKYIPWHTVVRILDKYAPGWEWQIMSLHTADGQLFLLGRLTLHCQDGAYSRDATGTEFLECKGYGDPSSNAESMAFRRAASRFGLGLYLYQR